MKRILSPLASVFLIVALAGCGTFEISDQRMQFQLGPDHNLGYQTPNGVTFSIVPRSMSFRNAPGAAPLQLTAVRVTIVDDTGTAYPTVETAMSLYLPAGLQCDDPHEELGCTMNSTNPVVAPGVQVEAEQTIQVLDAQVAADHFNSASQSSWYAEFVFEGFSSGGFTGAQQRFVTQPYRVGIVGPN